MKCNEIFLDIVKDDVIDSTDSPRSCADCHLRHTLFTGKILFFRRSHSKVPPSQAYVYCDTVWQINSRAAQQCNMPPISCMQLTGQNNSETGVQRFSWPEKSADSFDWPE